jgi:dihydroneopterin aldolase
VGDTIVLTGLEARTILGVDDRERVERRRVRVDLEIACDAAKAAVSDDLSDSIDYAAVARAVVEFVEESEFRLLESLAEGIAGVVRKTFHAKRVRVRVEKPGAVPGCETVAVVVERGP